MLLMSVMNWQPGASGLGGGFGFGDGMVPGAGASGPLLSFGPGLLSLLSDARAGSDG
jgi:hypothetical protein